MEPTNSGRVDQWSQCVESRYVSSASGTDISTATEASSLDCHFCGVDSPPAHVKWKEWWWKTLCPGLDTHRSPHSALFSKTGGRRGSYAPFGHIGARVRPQQRQRWRVEMCIFEWCGVVIGGLIEPSAGSRRLWNPGFSRVEKVACR